MFKWVDPWLEAGGRIGFISRVNATELRTVGSVGVGLDVRLSGGPYHPALTVLYRYEGGRTPAAGADHLILFGLGLRLSPPPD